MDLSYRNIWKITYPILVGVFIQQLIGMTDTAFLGRVGEIELGAAAIGSVFYITVYMIGFGFAAGAQIIIGQFNGAGEYRKIGPVLYQGLWFLLAAAAAIILAIRGSGFHLLGLLLHSPDILKATDIYLQVRIWGFIPVFVVIIFRAFYIGITDTRILTANALLMLFANVSGDYILIFGKFGFPEMGIRGAALASVIAESLSAVFFIIFTLTKTDLAKYALNKAKINFRIMFGISKVSVWTTLQYFFSLSTWFLFYVVIEHRGETELAISNILRSAEAIPFMIVPSLGATMNTVTANLVGSGNSDKVMPAAWKIVKLAYIIGLLIELVMALFPVPTMRIFTNEVNLIQQAVHPYYAMLTTYLTLVPGFIFLSIITGSGQTRTSMLIEWAGMFFYVIGVWLVVTKWQMSLTWCWLTEHSYNIPLGIITFWYIKNYLWKENRRLQLTA